MLMMINDEDNILSGASLNDEEDFGSTMQSIAQAEKALGTKMQTPEESTRFYQINGNKYESLMSNNDKISIAEIEHGLGERQDAKVEEKKVENKKYAIAQVQQ